MAMKKFVRRFSSASLDLPQPGKKSSRDRSVSELVESTESVRSVSQSDLEYLGYTYVKDPRSLREIQTAIRTVKQTSLNRNHWVQLVVKSGMLSVYETNGEALIMSSVACIAHCACELNRVLNDCLAITFASGHNAKQCHVFQARSAREASDLAQQVQKVSRGTNRPRSRGQNEVTVNFHKSQQLVESPKLGLHLMEDEEGEVIEHKPISHNLSRNESKKVVVRPPSTDCNSTSYLDSFSPYGKLGGGSMGFMTTPPKGRRRGGGGKMSKLREERGFTQQDKVVQLLNAADKVTDNNSLLKNVASKRTPSSPFEDALYSMHVSNNDLLRNYIQSGHIQVDACDSTGNTLLHYAAAIGNVDAVKILCTFLSPSMIDARGWNECTATHRAAADGNISTLRVLLNQNANPNLADLMRRTPLHLTSPRRELMECSIALLEAGAQIMAVDILGLRPFDLSPDLKETQSRLVISACELFSSSAPTSHLSSKGPVDTPTTASPISTRPSSIMSDINRSIDGATTRSDYGSHDFLRPHPSNPSTVAEASARVSHWMDTVGRRCRRRHSNQSRALWSRSMSNLSDLKEEEEDELRKRSQLEVLKFPSDFNLNSAYYELEETADGVMKNINELIKLGERVQSPMGRSECGRGWRGIRRQRSLSEPSLAPEDDVAMETPPGSQIGLPQSPLLGSKVIRGRPDSIISQSSVGTVVRSGEEDTFSKMSEAFDLLEEELWRKEREGGRGRRREMVRMSLPAGFMDRPKEPYHLPDSPLLERRTVPETEAIFDEILSQLQDFSRDLERRVTSPDYDRLSPKFPPKSFEGGHRQLSEGGIPEERPPRGPPHQLVNRKQLVSNEMGNSEIDGPGSIIRRFSGRRKEPPFLDEVLGGQRSPVGGPEKSTRKVPYRRVMTFPGRKSSPIPQTDSNVTLGQVNVDLLHHLSGLPDTPRSSVASSDEVAISNLEPATKALKLMVCVSRNKECLGTLVSYLCLPKFMDKIAGLAKSPATPPKALGYIAALITNIFEAGGADGRKTAMGSGFLDLIIKLLHSRDPIPGTCLSLLNGMLVSEEDNDHLQKIIRVPSEPLLMYLEPFEMSGSDADSGIGSRHLSRTTAYGSDNQVNISDSSRPNSDILMGANHEIPPPPSGSNKNRTNSFASEMSDTISIHSLASPTMKGPAISLLEARHIVLRMLSVSSCHRKMQRSLAKPHSIALLCGSLLDPNHENVTNAVVTLANMAQNVDCHEMLREAGLVAKLQDLLGNGTRQRFHATRGLVYMGELELATHNMFSENASHYEVDSVLLSTDEDDGHTYARGATFEKCVEFLTESISHLWGGFSLRIGPQSPSNDPLSKKATKQQIVKFFLTCYQSFMHPLILVRLLLHRLATPCSQNPFDWSVTPDRHTITSYSHTDSIPAHQMTTLKVIGRWLEDHPDDFVQYPQINDDITRIIQRLKLAKGPYTAHSHRLRSLQQDVNRPHSSTLPRHIRDRLPPHHNNLYVMMKRVVTNGMLPVTLDEAMYLTALQMHIETVAEPSPFISWSHVRSSGLHRSPTKIKRSFTGRLKSTLPSGYTKSKPLMKRVRALMQELEPMSERNSKHLFIERCQALPGYECTLYSVRVPQGARFRKEAKQILGVNSKKVVFLDEKTKELVSSHPLGEIGSVSVEEDSCSLVLLMEEGGPMRFHVESSRTAWDIKNIIQRGKDGGDLQPPEEVVRWSDSSQSTTTPLPPPSPTPSSSSLSSDENITSRETTPSPPSANPDSTASGPASGSILTPHSSPLHVQNGHIREDSFSNDLMEGDKTTDNTPLCDCPPDPEIPRHIVLHQLSISDVLQCPLETARQMTLIAHEHFGRVSSIELLQKVHLIPKNKTPSPSSSLPLPSGPQPSGRSKSSHIQVDIDTRPQTAVERLAYRFNQVGNWVASTILTTDDLDQRVEALQQYILIAKHCLDLRNYSTMMAIVMAGLGSAPIRRLHKTWDSVSKLHMEMFKLMDTILESKSNYKNYRNKLSITPVPAVPYIGVFLKDLTFIADGNPDYIRGGLINLHKRRQVYQKLEEISHFQQENYNYHVVPELQAYLLGFHPIPDEELHSKSHILEPRIRRSHSHSSSRGKSSSSTTNFFKALTRSSSSSSTNLLRTS